MKNYTFDTLGGVGGVEVESKVGKEKKRKIKKQRKKGKTKG